MDVLNRFLFQKECLKIGALILCSAGKVLNGHFSARIGRSVGQEAPGGGSGLGCLICDWICIICKINKGLMIIKHPLIRNICKKQRSPSSYKAWDKFHLTQQSRSNYRSEVQLLFPFPLSSLSKFTLWQFPEPESWSRIECAEWIKSAAATSCLWD